MQVAVPETDADGGYARRRCGNVGVVVGHAVVVRQRAHEGDAAEEGKRVAQLFVEGRGHGRIAVQNAPQTHHVRAGYVVVEHAGAAAQVAVFEGYVLREFAHCLLKGRDLAVGERDVLAGGGEVRVDALNMQVRELLQFVRQSVNAVREESGASHAGINADVQVHFFAVQFAQGVEMLSFFGRREGCPPSILHDNLTLFWETRSQDERTGVRPGVLHTLGLRYGSHAEKSDIFRIQRAHHALQPVAIGLRFHDSHTTVFRQRLLHHAQIVLHGVRVNFRPCAI